MTSGARTVIELVELAGVCSECEDRKSELNSILSYVSGCRNASLEAVVNAVKNGADTVEKVGDITAAGTGVNEETGEACGECKILIKTL